MKLVSIPKSEYEKYRLDLMFEGYKWDPQWIDNITVGRHVLVLTETEAKELEELTEKLHAETTVSEAALAGTKITRLLSLPFSMRTAARKMKNYDEARHVRLMRFDFHPVKGGGYAVSEVNSDVPGGLADATLSTVMSARLFGGKYYRYKNFGKILAEAIAKKTPRGGRVALIHCTSYSDDRQVMQFVGDALAELGLIPIYCAADHLMFQDKEAFCLLDGNEGKIDAYMRFTPLEWLPGPGFQRGWRGYFDCVTTSCNHPVSLFWQTKATPFAWDELEKRGVTVPTWRKLLPETLRPRAAKDKQGFIYKPAFGRTGEGITIKAAMKESEYKKALKDVARRPRRYVAQKMFDSQPLTTEDGESFHVCLGVYSVEGAAAGFYARISSYARIDSSSIEVPVLVEGSAPSDAAATPCPEGRFAYGRKIHEIWAPSDALWTNWTRPVPFIFLKEHEDKHLLLGLTTPQICYLQNLPEKTAVILDLPDNDAIEEGLSLARRGFRPVALYNGVKGQQGATELVPTHGIEDALILGAEILKTIKLPLDAPPVFMLDSNRAFKKRALEIYDNGWDVFPQDFPSANYFKTHGINNILVRGEKIRKDLAAVLYNVQTGGMKIYFTDGFSDPKEVTVKKPKKI